MNIENFILQLHPIWDASMTTKIVLVSIMCFLSTIATTIYLHRYLTHQSVILTKITEHFFAGILWLNTGIPPLTWKLAHKHHHAHSDEPDDIQSPLNPLLLFGSIPITGPLVPLIRYFMLLIPLRGKNGERLQLEVARTKQDWFSRTFYHKLYFLGPIILCSTYLLLFGAQGFFMFLIQFLYLPVVAGMIINGFGHSKKTPNTAKPEDHAVNILGFIDKLPKFVYWIFFPLWFAINFTLNILTGGEFRHHTHHVYQNSARITEKRFQFDIGWVVIYILLRVGLLKEAKYNNSEKDRVILRLSSYSK